MHMNKVFLIGNLGATPELRFTPSGAEVTNLRVATNRKYKDKQGELHERTDWHRVVVWGKQAAACAQNLTKGRLVLVEGELRTRQYDDKEGNTRTVVEIHAAPGGVTFGPRMQRASSEQQSEEEYPPDYDQDEQPSLV